MKQTDLPPRLRESAFQRFEQDILLIMRCFPMVVELENLQGLAITTYTARLRDAMISLDRFDWPTKIDKVRFREVYSQIHVAHIIENGKIVAGSRQEIREYRLALAPEKQEVKLVKPSTTTFEGKFIALSRAELCLIADLAAHKLLTQPIKLLYSSLDLDKDISYVEDNFDVSISREGDTITIL